LEAETINQLIEYQAKYSSDSIAILALDRQPLEFGQLYQFLQTTAGQLNGLGIGRNDRVAIVLPNGPEMAVAFLAVTAAATCAPLNPAYTAPEFDFYLADLEIKALLTVADTGSLAIEVAQTRGIPVIELTPVTAGPAGTFKLTGDRRPLTAQPGFAQGGDVALMLHTSGTTSRPKMVPLSHSNLCASARHICETLQLTEADRCLNIMPLFHIHGLLAATLSSLAAGASLVCTPGFYATHFFDWMAAYRPTWYTAVPTMHQAILSWAFENQHIIEKNPLRFIRSCSSSLAPQVMAELERTFGVPVIEAYGMTEASHQITSNPLPPQPRKQGSVGIPAGPEVAIMAENGEELLRVGEVGEIVIRGLNVTRGYVNNPEANAKGYTKGWFRTGDQGYMDEDGYVFIQGRLKEIINRGGEKISPREVEEELLGHPAVVQALVFAIPDEALGEEVAAVVVLADPAVSEVDLRRFVAVRLSYFKVPRRIDILEEIPLGPTGKLQRLGMAEKLGLTQKSARTIPETQELVPPSTLVEEVLAELWCEVLKISQVGVNQFFVDLGGDSILAAQLVSRVRQRFGVELSLVHFLQAGTIMDQAPIVESKLLEEMEDLAEPEEPTVSE
jgi:acyl-CoA synthetase (AMP-forming)/AMP-acid ligase II/acyl carrier protein